MHHGLPQCGDDDRLVAAIGYMPHTKLQRDASGGADKHDRLRLSDPICEACRLTGRLRLQRASTERDPDVVFPALMLLQAWKS